jgi:hypothetical protein
MSFRTAPALTRPLTFFFMNILQPQPYTSSMRYLLTIVVTALLVGGGVYYWQTELQPSGSQAGAMPAGRGGFGGGQAVPLVGVTPVSRETIYDTIQAIGTAQAN